MRCVAVDIAGIAVAANLFVGLFAAIIYLVVKAFLLLSALTVFISVLPCYYITIILVVVIAAVVANALVNGCSRHHQRRHLRCFCCCSIVAQ